MRMLNNYVHILLDRKTDEIKVGQLKLYIDTSFNEEAHRPIVGVVRNVPEKLKFIDGDWSQMPWDTDMELKIGDEVILKRPAVSGAIANGFVKEDEEGLHVFVKYSEVVVARRGDCIIPLNGFVLVEPLEEEYKTSLALPETSKKDSKIYGKIIYIGTPNRRYITKRNGAGVETTEPPDTDELKVGDIVAFSNVADIYLEYDLHRTIKKCYRMQQHKILAKI